MDNPDTPKTRRPLPTPGAPASQRPSTPILSPAPIPTSSFYGTKAPPLPSRPKNPGSSHTAYVPPARYNSPSYDGSSGYREPELVEDVADEDDTLPDLIPQSDTNWASDIPEDNSVWQAHNWSSSLTDWENSNTPSNWAEKVHTTVGTTDYSMDYLNSSRIDDFTIDGRSHFEELNWWNPEERAKNKRPGFGILPPILAEELHDPNHSLFSVNITTPQHPANTHISSTPTKDQSSPGPSNTSSSPPHAHHATSDNSPPPSEDEIRMSVPHPNAYYCPKDNGWVILSWKSSSVPPPLSRTYINNSGSPLPDQSRRRQTQSCIEDSDQPFGKTNKTHHFHKYEKAVDSHKLTPPFRQDEWQILENLKQRRRAGTIITSDTDINTAEPGEQEGELEDEGQLLDLYVCSSGVIPGVIPRKYIDELVKEKKAHPMLNRTGEATVLCALETFLTAIENKLWKGNNRQIKVMSSGFQAKVGWNPNIKRIFECLGFVEEAMERDSTLKPPVTDTISAVGKQNRRKLLRAWVEIGSWVADYKKLQGMFFVSSLAICSLICDLASYLKDIVKEFKLYVQLDSAREMYQTAIGAHPDQIPRGGLSDTLLEAVRPLEAAWRGLGLTATTFSADMLIFAYLAQCRCDPGGTSKYFSYLTAIVKQLEEYGGCPAQVQELVVMEQSRERFTLDDVANAATTLGFGSENVLGVEYDQDDIPDEFVENAWKDCVKRSWRDHEHGSETQRHSNEALRILAESRGSITLRKAWEVGKNKYMNPDRAYDTLEIPKDVDDHMLITVYNMRLEETPMQLEKMREAMSVIAEVRDSERLRQFISSGLDPGEIIAPTRSDLPRGLNQLGNTCYLNSLLQYFYTIKDLREAVLPMSKLDIKALDDEKLSDEDLKRHRVGGRLVTRREIIRSRKFINQLAELFFHLEYSENPAVTPTIELAKLALITSRDEEEDEMDKGGTDSSNDTDATLVDDGPLRSSAPEYPQTIRSPSSPNSVLGKRPRDMERQNTAMDVDVPLIQSPKDKDGFNFSPSQKDPSSSGSNSSRAEASSSKLLAKGTDGDSKMLSVPTSQKPVPPPRKRVETNDSTMMFGKQHDVAECMDNCMFQIETALLRFDDMNDDSGKTSVVKSLFYGKIRQRLTAADAQQSRASIHEKEDLFSHLPVNVTNDGVDIYDGLSGYFDDIVDFEGRKARMEVTLVDLPPVLQIQLQRVQFNRETLQPYKSQAYVKFGENLYMDRFLDSANPDKKSKSKAIQTELNACRERVRILVEGKDLPYASSLEHTQKFLFGLQSTGSISAIEDETLQQLEDEKKRINDDIDRLRARIDVLKTELETIWADCKQAAYELTSVFIHRGSSPSWGHYFFYSRHLPGSPDSWFKYNDSDVTVVSKDEVLCDTTGSTANPYLLVFARKDSNVVDTVKRFDPSMLDSS
ncbi:putative ubiquitin carboxyl-terminal hydrolase 2 [Psilocybe cubensis]|uniref:Ubiquitin carboxyl-terminal hydrolase 2 n=2 Tax=Psilocybe cubensis TaxID=181762 RepID=A0ACB8HEQ8_PSICU|nr:putative ubiquitin carboxyl-terminal hydrolase 2 [Psilocybe cubensis]KAH9486398.1 putative ubiquitin carboxyl-terminal hydrolase 2 [Psilocybe cubensis]